MGPGCFHPRNPPSAQRKACWGWLQWGRDVSIPEIPAMTTGRRVVAGFNGAGMFPSQKCVLAGLIGDPQSPLQWGRDVSIPEIGVPPITPPPVVELQWGRDVSIPEMCVIGIRVSGSPGFNGAGMFPSQKSLPRPPQLTHVRCFNGAGMFPSQKWMGERYPRSR